MQEQEAFLCACSQHNEQCLYDCVCIQVLDVSERLMSFALVCGTCLFLQHLSLPQLCYHAAALKSNKSFILILLTMLFIIIFLFCLLILL